MPSHERRSELLREFVKLYKWSFEKSIYSALRVQGGMDNFDYRNKVISFDLRYRKNCGGNPGLSFTVANAAFCAKEEIQATPAFILQMAHSNLISKHLALQGEKDFVGLMVALYKTDSDFVFHFHEIYHHSPVMEESIVQLRHDIWLEELKKNVENGYIFMQRDSCVATLGRMKVHRSKWSWVPMSEGEIEAMGLQTLSARGLPGEGFGMLF